MMIHIIVLNFVSGFLRACNERGSCPGFIVWSGKPILSLMVLPVDTNVYTGPLKIYR
jgi:hypothetical protein